MWLQAKFGLVNGQIKFLSAEGKGLSRRSKKYLLSALEIGTNKICMLVAEYDSEEGLRLLGVGQSPSRGILKGNIIHASLAQKDVQTALAQAEKMSGEAIRRVTLNVAGPGLQFQHVRRSIPIHPPQRTIHAEDIETLKHQVRSVQIPPDHKILHFLQHRFFVDGGEPVDRPEGKPAEELGMEATIVHMPSSLLEHRLHLMKTVELEVAHLLPNGIATALSVTTGAHRQGGVLVIDIGGGTTDYALFHQGKLLAVGSVPVGGNHVTLDLAAFLNIEIPYAEICKKKYAHSILSPRSPDQIVEESLGPQNRRIRFRLGSVRRVVEARLEEIFQIVRELLAEQKLDYAYRSQGIILAGGCARIEGLTQLAERVFGTPAQVGSIHGFPQLEEYQNLNQPEFATPFGLLLYMQNQIMTGGTQSKADRRGFWRRIWSLARRRQT